MTLLFSDHSFENEIFDDFVIATDDESATTIPRTYQIRFKNQLINLIDTPGIGDPRGDSRDRENFDTVLQHLMNYPELNAICILLTPNYAKLNMTFKYCVKELLKHLHGVSWFNELEKSLLQIDFIKDHCLDKN